MKFLNNLFKKKDSDSLKKKLDVNKDGTVDFQDLRELNEKFIRKIEKTQETNTGSKNG